MMKDFLGRIKHAASIIKEKSAEYRVDHHTKVAGKAALKGVTVVAGKAQEGVTRALDSFTGTDTDKAVQEHILQQGRYNDAFANKLDEALRRISELEKRINKK